MPQAARYKGRRKCAAPGVYRPFRAEPFGWRSRGSVRRRASHSPLATFWPRLRRYTLCATPALLSCATIYPRRAKRLPEPIMVVVCEGDPGCAATPRACPGYLLAAPSALHAVRNASLLVVRNHILVLRSCCLNPSSLPCAKLLREPIVVLCEAVA